MIEEDLLEVVRCGDAHVVGYVKRGELSQAFDLLNGEHQGRNDGDDVDVPIFQSMPRDLMRLYAAFHLAAYRAGDLLPLKPTPPEAP